jgi:hypothetical protein
MVLLKILQKTLKQEAGWKGYVLFPLPVKRTVFAAKGHLVNI